MQRNFYQSRRAWCRRVLKDASLTEATKVVGVFLVEEYLNRHTNEAWPSQARVARELGFSAKTVHRSIKALVEESYLTINRTKRATNTYRLTLSDRRRDSASPGTVASYADGHASPLNQMNEPEEIPSKDEACSSKFDRSQRDAVQEMIKELGRKASIDKLVR